MQEALRLPLSRARLQVQMGRNETLFDHTADFIFQHLFMFVNKDADIKMQIESLPKPIRAEMLPRLTNLKCANPDGDLNQFEIILNGFEALLTSKTTEITLGGLLTFCPRALLLQKLAEMVAIIGKNAPDLEFLTINEINLKDVCIEFNGRLGIDALEKISNLRKLKKLRMVNCLIIYPDLNNLGKKLPALEDLEIVLQDTFDTRCYFDLMCPWQRKLKVSGCMTAERCNMYF